MNIHEYRARTLIGPMLLLCFSLSILSGQKPAWVTGQGQSTKYSRLIYLTGYGVAHLGRQDNSEDRKQQAVEAARRNLIEQIQVKIRSESTTSLQATNIDYSDFYASTTVSSSSLEIWGLEASTYYDRRKKLWHALVATRKDQLLESYRRKTEGLAGEIKEHFEAGLSREAAGQPTEALAEYLLCYPLFDHFQEAANLMFAVGAVTFESSFGELPATPRGKITRAMLREAVDHLIERPIRNAKDLAWSLAYQLDKQLDSPGGSVMTTPFTFQDTRMGSPFARYFQPILDHQLTSMARWGIVPQTAQFEAGGQRYVLTGRYWEQPAGIKLMAEVRRIPDGELVASADVLVAASILQATNRDLKPQNFSTALSEQKQFRKDEVIGGGLMVDVWTDRGAENLLYTDGEILRIYVRVNVPSYIRMIYHFADGTRTLLMDSHYIDDTKVNKVYQLPDEFECAPPFGPEVLQVFARTEPFDPVETVEEDGYYILKDDLPQFLAQTRGFKRKKPETMQAERRVRITTLAKE